MKGILNIDKPAGLTSHDVVSKARKILSERAIGHMGTLDPQGTGVLMLGVGKATRLFDYFLNKDKVYDAEFTFGYETDTLDKDGTVTVQTDYIPSLAKISEAAEKLMGKTDQIPPDYSAKSVGGVRAHVLARRGEAAQLKACPVEVYGITLLNARENGVYRFRIHCSAGTYIRSICRDMAYMTNSLATMTAIDRVRCGAFKKENAVSLEQLSELKEKAIISIEDALKDCPRLDLPDAMYGALITGKKIEYEFEEKIFTAYCKNELFGIGKITDGFLKIAAYLRD